MSNQSADRDGDERAHLDDVEAGAGCVEIWERLSERRAESEAGACDDD